MTKSTEAIEFVLPSEVPTGWRLTTLGDVGKYINGRGFKKSEWSDKGLPIIRIQNLTGTGKEQNYYDGDIDERHVVNPGDLLISWAATLGAYIWRGPRAALNQHIFKVRSFVDKKFHYYLMQRILGDLYRHTHGSGMVHITKSKFDSMPVLVPETKDQQKRIVAEIEKQFSRLDEAVANLKRVKANLKRYKAAVLKAAVEGRLVETEADVARREGRKYESAEKLIDRTKRPARPNRYKSRSKDLVIGHSGLAVGNPKSKLPDGWVWVPLVDIARMESGHTPSRKHSEWWNGEIPWVGIADARENNGKRIVETDQSTNEDGLANSAARLLPTGTVCVSRTASVGYVVVMGRDMATSQDFVNWTPTAAVLSDWLRIVFLVDRDALLKFGKGSVHKTIYFPEWLSMHISLPPISEQRRIVCEVDRRISAVNQIEIQVDANLQRAERLRQSILASAFSGHLIKEGQPQRVEGRKDVPANVRHFSRAVLSAEIVHRLHKEPTFGRVKHQKIFHLCEYIAQLDKLQGEYKRKAAGPLDNKLIYANESELKRQQWYQTVSRQGKGHKYEPLEKAGSHQKYFGRYWPEKLGKISELIELMRTWTTERCGIFSTVYAAWNDLLIWGVDATDDAILHEILNRWNETKRRIPESQWRNAIHWMRHNGYAPVGFGNPTSGNKISV